MPMQAHALTLARAIATIRRQRLVAELDADHSDGAPAIIHVAAHDACPKCAALDGVVTDQLGAWIFPPDDCRCAGAFGIELKALARNTR